MNNEENEKRQARAARVLEFYKRELGESGTPGPDDLADLLTDLCHGQTPGAVLEALKSAYHHHAAETSDRETDGVRYVEIGQAAHAALYSDEECEIDDLPLISEGDDNGCYVMSWAWFAFSGTKWDKSTEEGSLE